MGLNSGSSTFVFELWATVTPAVAILDPREEDRVGARDGPIRRRERLGGLLNFYWRKAG